MKRSLLSLFTTLCAAIACAQVPFELTADRAPKVHTGGNCLIIVCEIAVTCAFAVRISTPGWKNILTMPMPV